MAANPTRERRSPVLLNRPQSTYVPIREVAARLGLTEGKVYRDIAAGIIPSHRSGAKLGRVNVVRSEFEAWLRGERAPSTDASAPLARVDLSSLVGHDVEIEMCLSIGGTSVRLPLTVHVAGVAAKFR